MKLFYQIFLIPYFLHHSQTPAFVLVITAAFEYHTYLHHSQTLSSSGLYWRSFEYHTYLHHSQTTVILIGIR